LKQFQNSKKTLLLLPISILAVTALSLAPVAAAYGNTDNWQIAFSGTFITPGGGNGGFWGWCALAGVSSGTDGDCQVSNYGHAPGGGSFTCEVSIDITGWSTGVSSQLPPFLPGLFINSGHATAHPGPASATCLAISFPPGTVDVNTGKIIAPFDTAIPLAPGHYNMNFNVPGTFIQSLQIQVTFTHG